jgi:putative hemolysin
MIPLDAVFMCEKGSELDALSRTQKRLYTRIPVFAGKHDNIIGVFNIKDYFYTGTIEPRKPFFVNARDRCMTIFSMMKQKGEHMAVVQRDSRVVGIVTLEDLIEELVGEIRDER